MANIKYIKIFLFLLVCSFIISSSVQSAHALATLRLSDGSTVIDIADGSGSDLSSTTGIVVYSGAVGNFGVNITTGITKPVVGSAGSPQLDLNDISITTTESGTLTIWFSETDFSFASSSAQFITSVGGTSDGTTSFQTYFDNNNALFGTTSSVGSLGAYVAGQADDPFSGVTNGIGSTDGSYSITAKATITHNASGENTSFNMNVNVVPEPVSSVLFIVGGATLGFRSFRKKFRK